MNEPDYYYYYLDGDMTHHTVETLIRDLNCVTDQAESARLFLTVLMESIDRLKHPDTETETLCRDFIGSVRASHTENTPLMHLINYFESDMDSISARADRADGQWAINSLAGRIAQLDRHVDFVAENGLSRIEQEDLILVLHPDKTIENLLVTAQKALNRNLRVVLLDCCQDECCKTGETLKAAGIDCRMIADDRDLADIADQANRLFLGGMTVTSDRKILAPGRTSQIVDLCHSKGVKVHLFVSSLWFAPRRSTDMGQVAVGSIQDDFSLGLSPCDMVCLHAIDHVVTEFGEVTADGQLTVPPVSLARLKAIDERAKVEAALVKKSAA